MIPELLLPAGNPEAFFAAIEGGADAIYLGLRKFNARGNAGNFAPNQLQALLKESQARKINVYLTLNTIIKNSELNELLDTLYLISQTTVTAVIIQDLGVLYLLRKYFPELKIFASTQMGIHNSLGCNYLHSLNFSRVILSRELTFPELSKISDRSRIELELFTHGALCYSFSGMCLFSSYLGGMSANRGACRQPCRRVYQIDHGSGFFFSLKDLELIDHIPRILKLQITSLKIEGRMRSAEYVYQVARAYRIALDDPNRIPEAKELLKIDMGREKTTYFMGENVNRAMATIPFTGIDIGKVEEIDDKGFLFRTSHPLKFNDRLRVLNPSGQKARAIKIKEMQVNQINVRSAVSNDLVKIITDKIKVDQGNKVILSGIASKGFSTRFSQSGKHLKLTMPIHRKENILNKIGSIKTGDTSRTYVRIPSSNWIRKLYLDRFDYLILNFTRKNWIEFDHRNDFFKRNRYRFIIELPKFIDENMLEYYRDFCIHWHQTGITNFMINHLYQLNLLPFRNLKIATSENIYLLNDAAIQFVKEQKISLYTYPLENDFDNLIKGKDRKGIVPLYFYPELFYSRMPVKIDDTEKLKDISVSYRKYTRDGITRVVPENPVCLFQYRKKLLENGFSRFLIDFSYLRPSQRSFNRIFDNYERNLQEKNSRIFNFKSGLK